MQAQADRGDLAIVMTGGGARAAYQIGILKVLARYAPDTRIDILTGVSAGGINAVCLAASRKSLRETIDDLAALWSNLRIDDVFRVDLSSQTQNALRWVMRLASGGAPGAPRARGLVDTSPLDTLLRRVLPTTRGEIAGIAQNLQDGLLKAVALTTLNYSTGQSVTWVQGRDIKTWERPNRRSMHASITPSHVMASAALPLIFPAIQVGNAWYGDGGIRLAAPLSPALHLGGRRLLAMSTRYNRTFDEADVPTIHGYPPPIQVIGHLMNAIFLDVIDQDVLRMQKLNAFIEKLPEEDRGEFRPIELLVFRPSRDLGKLAGKYEATLPRRVRFLFGGLGTRETSSPDFLSMLLFQPEFLQELIAIGEADAEARKDELIALVRDDPDQSGLQQVAR